MSLQPLRYSTLLALKSAAATGAHSRARPDASNVRQLPSDRPRRQPQTSGDLVCRVRFGPQGGHRLWEGAVEQVEQPNDLLSREGRKIGRGEIAVKIFGYRLGGFAVSDFVSRFWLDKRFPGASRCQTLFLVFGLIGVSWASNLSSCHDDYGSNSRVPFIT